MTPRTLIYDIETAPNTGYTWAKWDTNVIEFSRPWYILSVAWKWRGERATHVLGLNDFEGYKPGCDDFNLASHIRELFNECDIAITHNGNSFDQPKARARMLFHKLDPPEPFREVDTLKVARKHFAIGDNTLDYLCKFLELGDKGVGGKKPGFSTWLGCMEGDEKAWARMKRYNAQDVVLLERLYERLLPWIDEHPNMALITEDPTVCPKCKSDAGFISGGWKYHRVTKARRWQCKACRGWCTGRRMVRSDAEHVPG